MSVPADVTEVLQNEELATQKLSYHLHYSPLGFPYTALDKAASRILDVWLVQVDSQ